MRVSLPIDATLAEALAALDKSGSLVLTASPGSGKTTRFPAALLAQLAAERRQGEIWILEPRRIAARAAARRVAQECGSRLGDLVGFVVRHERVRSRSTRLLFVTEGILLRRILEDPGLEGIAAVILDEVHERHVETDLALAMLREVRETLRPDLLLVAMSATLHAAPFMQYLGAAQVDVQARPFPVETRWDERRDDAPLAERVARAVAESLAALDALASNTAVEGQGACEPKEAREDGVLVFLPGIREIQAASKALAPLARRQDLAVLALHGSLEASAQDRAILPHAQRKVVLATNVAESSLTVSGIRAVVDSGLARIPRLDARSGLDRLQIEEISRASAEQRRGRAGRTGPGFCRRLWTRGEERQRPEFDEPELLRTEVSGACLSVRAFAGRSAQQFAWFEAPAAQRLARAEALLERLDAVTQDGALSAIGKAMLRLPLEPRLARLQVAARDGDCEYEAACVAALLSERDPLAQFSAREAEEEGAVLLRVRLLAEADGLRTDSEFRRLGLEPRSARAILRVVRQICGRAKPAPQIDEEALTRAVLAGFPDRVARRNSDDAQEAFLVGGARTRLGPHTVPHGCRLFLALELRATSPGASSKAGLALPLERAWLHEALIEESDEGQVLAKEGRVRRVRRTRYLGLTLAEEFAGDAPCDVALPLLAELLRKQPERWLGAQNKLHALAARLAWLAGQGGVRDDDDSLPVIDANGILSLALEALPRLIENRQSLQDFAKIDLAALAHARWPALRSRLAREAPEHITLPCGRKAEIDYGAAAGPSVKARIQELYGCRELPRLAAGRVPLVLELLGPNQRPVQITTELEGFWTRSYPGIRAELKRRYPRHAWPEDPLNARPESRPQRRPRKRR